MYKHNTRILNYTFIKQNLYIIIQIIANNTMNKIAKTNR